MERPILLLVEDNETLRRVMSSCLLAAGFAVHSAASAAEARALGAHDSLRGKLDLLLTDCHLEDANDGFRLLEFFRACQPNLPAVLISADADLDLESRGALAGFQRVFRKPTQVCDLVSTLRELIDTRNGNPASNHSGPPRQVA